MRNNGAQRYSSALSGGEVFFLTFLGFSFFGYGRGEGEINQISVAIQEGTAEGFATQVFVIKISFDETS